MSISVVICTYNRALLLRRTLESFNRLHTFPDMTWELIVVDNNSTDDTQHVVNEFCSALPLRYVFEPKQGLSHARNRALKEVQHDLVLWTDDDVDLDPEWLTEYARAMITFPDAAFFGGTIDPHFVVEPPPWFSRNLDVFGSALALRQFGPQSHRIEELSQCPYGANMALRKSALDDVCFDIELGRGVADLLGGEELTMFRHLLQRGRIGVWIGSACVKHVVSSDRLTHKYLWNYFYWAGRTKERQLQNSSNDVDIKKINRKYRRLIFEKWRLNFLLRRNDVWASRFIRCAKWLGRIDEMRSKLKD